MDKLLSNSAQVSITSRAKDIYVISNWSNDAYQYQQNRAERKYQHIEITNNRMVERNGSSNTAWLLAIIYVCYP